MLYNNIIGEPNFNINLWGKRFLMIRELRNSIIYWCSDSDYSLILSALRYSIIFSGNWSIIIALIVLTWLFFEANIARSIRY